MSARFTNVIRTPKFATARGRLARGALVPSRVWDDTSVWTSREGSVARTLTLEGSVRGNHYVLATRADAPAPAHVADARHVIRLRRLEGADWEWTTHVEHAIGSLRAADAAAAVSALLAGVEGRDERAIRADYGTAFPRGTASLGRLFTLDSVRTARDGTGATAVRAAVSIHPERLDATLPAYARYVRKYVVPSSYDFALVDARGDRWLEATAARSVLRVRARVLNGALVPLEGAPRAMPDTLELRGDFLTHIMLFDVGVRGLVSQMAFVRTPHERGWSFRFAREPEWQLPPVVGRLVRAPLRRFFTGDGSALAISVRDGPAGGQSLLVRDARVAVRESAIVRWLGALGWTAMGDFVGDAEAEENRFNAELFAAFQADVRAFPYRMAETSERASEH